ncbi:MAG: heme ABC exporter ATP-binding protein CcmA [Candidatus Angelobacter sp.]
MRLQIRACPKRNRSDATAAKRLLRSPLNEASPVRVENVSKVYGRTAAVRNVSLELEPGRFYVLRGENGAGKSTLLRIIAGLNEPTEGKVFIFGIRNKEARAQIGYMAHAPLLYDELTGMENLRFFAQLYGIQSDQPLMEAIQRVGLDPGLERRVGEYSQGMRQRLSLARAIFHSPSLLLLDEPFSNVDPDSAAAIAKLLAHMRDEGRTIVLVTHQIGLLSAIADEVLILSRGELAQRGAMQQVAP